MSIAVCRLVLPTAHGLGFRPAVKSTCTKGLVTASPERIFDGPGPVNCTTRKDGSIGHGHLQACPSRAHSRMVISGQFRTNISTDTDTNKDTPGRDTLAGTQTHIHTQTHRRRPCRCCCPKRPFLLRFNPAPPPSQKGSQGTGQCCRLICSLTKTWNCVSPN
eukprot:2635451-Rhodomonas_salina.1